MNTAPPKKLLAIFFIALMSLLNGCSSGESTDIVLPSAEVETEDDKIFIIDEEGKRWEVTDAVRQYGFQADQFQFGLGGFAIRPINNPRYLAPEDPGYPSPNSSQIVIGTKNGTTPMAYPTSIMKTSEMVNEVFLDGPVAIAY
jgi:hypothetical protein